MSEYNQHKRKRLLIGGGFGLMKLQQNRRGRWVVGMREDIPFGIFGIDKNKLKDNILSICRLSTGKKVDGFPNRKIHDKMKLIVLEMLQGVQPSISDELNQKDFEYVHKIIKRSRVTGLELPKTKFTDSELNNKLSVNLGQIKSGNNSKSLLEETKEILNILAKKGYYNQFQVDHTSKIFQLQ